MKKILFLFAIVFLLASVIIHNNYSINQNICIYSNIAEPIFNISFNEAVILDNINTVARYSFKISNFKDNIISDIPFYYYFHLENLTPDFSISCYMDNTEITLSNFMSEKYLLNNLTKEEHIFTIIINYTGNFTTSILTNFKLKLIYEQCNR